MAKIKLHNILHSTGQTLLTIHLEEWKAKFLPSVFYALREEGIAIPFVVQSVDGSGHFTLSLATAQNNLDWVQSAFQEGLDLSQSTPPKVRNDVVLITLYGPHLGEIPGIASRILSALTVDRVGVLAVSASLNSALLVVPLESLPQSLRSLDRLFEIP